MLYTGDFEDVSSKYDEVWVIVRSLKILPKGDNVKHVPELSPRPELFFETLKWKKNHHWSSRVFEKEYTPWFLKDIKQPEAMNKLLELRDAIKKKNILVVCFCKNESFCHRSIIKKLANIPDLDDFLKNY